MAALSVSRLMRSTRAMCSASTPRAHDRVTDCCTGPHRCRPAGADDAARRGAGRAGRHRSHPTDRRPRATPVPPCRDPLRARRSIPAPTAGPSRRRRQMLTGDLMEAIRQLCGRPTSRRLRQRRAAADPRRQRDRCTRSTGGRRGVDLAPGGASSRSPRCAAATTTPGSARSAGCSATSSTTAPCASTAEFGVSVKLPNPGEGATA